MSTTRRVSLRYARVPTRLTTTCVCMCSRHVNNSHPHTHTHTPSMILAASRREEGRGKQSFGQLTLLSVSSSHEKPKFPPFFILRCTGDLWSKGKSIWKKFPPFLNVSVLSSCHFIRRNESGQLTSRRHLSCHTSPFCRSARTRTIKSATSRHVMVSMVVTSVKLDGNPIASLISCSKAITSGARNPLCNSKEFGVLIQLSNLTTGSPF